MASSIACVYIGLIRQVLMPNTLVFSIGSVCLDRKVRRFTWKGSQWNICDDRRGLVELTVRTSAQMPSKYPLHSDNIELGLQQVCIWVSTGNDLIPHVTLLAEQHGKTLLLGAYGKQHG